MKGKTMTFLFSALLMGTLITAGSIEKAKARPQRGAGDCPRQMQKGPHHGGVMGIYFLEKEVGISEKQAQDIFDINTKYRKKIFDNRADTEAVRELRDEQREEILNVLTKEQLVKLQELRRRGPRNGGPGMGQ